MALRSEDPPIAQACTLVLPSDGRFDSRAWRIAGSLAARGHHVTVLARSAPGLADREDHEAGYRILRVPVSAQAGLPRPLQAMAGLARRRDRAATGGADEPLSLDSYRSAGDIRPTGLAARIRAAIAGAWRLAAIALTVRSQRLASRPVAPRADIVHAMAYMGIAVGLDLGSRDHIPVVYDARDVYVEARNIARLPGPARRLFAAIERRWARRASRVMTVNRAYADVMAERFAVDRPAIVMNCPYRPAPHEEQTGSPRSRAIHERLELDEAVRIVLYHGGLSAERGIEQLIAALPLLPDDVHLVLLGYGPHAEALAEAARDPAHRGRLHVLPAVPPGELLTWVSGADIAAMPIQPSTLNHRLTTPNKLFEAMTAGVPVVASDLPGMAAIVRATGCGVLCDPTDPGAIAAAIRTILDAPLAVRTGYAAAGEAAARGAYSWEAQFEVLLAEYGRLTGRPW